MGLIADRCRWWFATCTGPLPLMGVPQRPERAELRTRTLRKDRVFDTAVGTRNPPEAWSARPKRHRRNQETGMCQSEDVERRCCAIYAYIGVVLGSM